MKETFKCYIKTLAPIHIGCDEIYEPTGFLIDENARTLNAFDPIAFISSLDAEERDKIMAICRKGDISSILEIYKFLRGKTYPGKEVGVCQGFVSHYQKTLFIPTHKQRMIQQELNKFEISRTSFLAGDQRPYIPGSSVKGAIRTAYLNDLNKANQAPTEKWKYTAKNLEKKLLDSSSFDTDPFRMLKVSDFMPVGDIKAKIVYAVNEKKKSSAHEARGPYQILEVILPGAVFEGLITVERPLGKSKIRRPLSLKSLSESLKSFYKKEKNREQAELQKIQLSHVFEFGDQALPIRIGQHSGAESVTIEGHRDIRIMGVQRGDAKFDDHATTFWFASDESKAKDKSKLLPFGWAELHELTGNLENEFSEKETVWVENKKKARAKQKEEIQRQEQEVARAGELKKARELEEKREAEEAVTRKAALDAMSPEDRAIEELKSLDITEARAVEIYNGLDEFSDDKRWVAAQGLKDYWVSIGKWKKKGCSKKQLKKVAAVKGLIGE